jgi:hypothetical protein
MDANMSLQHALDHEKVDHLMQNNINAKLDNGTDADRNDIAHLGSEEQSQHQEDEHHELESELVNFDQNLEEAAMNHGREQEGGGYEHGNGDLEGNVDELNGDSEHGSHHVGQDFLTTPTGQDLKERERSSHGSLPGMSESGQLPQLNLPYDATRSGSRPSSSSRNMESNLTTSLSHVTHAYSHSPMSDVNLQNMTSAEYQALEPGSSQQFTQYGDVSQLPTRRQNVACDACRARKVKCVRKPMAEQVSGGQAERYGC